MKDLYNDITNKVGLSTQVIASDTTTVGAVIDTTGASSVTVLMQAGVVTLGDVTILLEDSDDNISYAPVTDEFLLGTEVATLLDTTDTTAKLGYIGGKQYVRASAVTANSANLTVGMSVILESLRTNPDATQVN